MGLGADKEKKSEKERRRRRKRFFPFSSLHFVFLPNKTKKRLFPPSLPSKFQPNFFFEKRRAFGKEERRGEKKRKGFFLSGEERYLVDPASSYMLV